MAAIMPKGMLAFALLALLALGLAPQHSDARFRDMDIRSSRRGLVQSCADAASSSSVFGPGMTAEMIPYHHVRSPFHQPNLTRAERLALSARRSRARGNRINRRLIDVDEAFTSPGVYYNDGSYVMNFTIGTPASTFLAIADTGSDLCWVQCQGCDPCFQQPDNFFNSNSSSTYTTVPCTNSQCATVTNAACDSSGETCQYHYPYGDGSDTDGTLSQETLTLFNTAGLASTFGSFYFGCGFNESGNFGDTDGLVGLGQGPLSLVSQLGGAINHTFSYCLVDDTVLNLTSALLLGNAGNLTLAYTPLLADSPTNPTYYYVDLQGISVGDVSITYDAGTFDIDELGNGGIILDSGTTLTLLAEAAYAPLLQELRNQVSYTEVDGSQHGFDLCYDTSAVTTATPDFPPVSFTLGNLVLKPDPNRNIFAALTDDGSVYCLAFSATYTGMTSIFGNIWQQNFQIAYDLYNHTVGFAATTCGTS